MARRDMGGAVDVAVLDAVTGGDDVVADEILGLFAEQAAMWSGMLTPDNPGWRDAAHTLRGAAAGIGAGALAEACVAAEAGDGSLERVRHEIDRALADVAAWRHELMLRSLRT